jgi:hypothetical protein
MFKLLKSKYYDLFERLNEEALLYLIRFGKFLDFNMELSLIIRISYLKLIYSSSTRIAITRAIHPQICGYFYSN